MTNKIDVKYVVAKSYPAGELRYLIQRTSDGLVVADDIEDRMYAKLLCEAFNLLGENVDRALAGAMVPQAMKS